MHSTSHVHAHGKRKFGFIVAPRYKEEAKTESAVSELVM
jgi:hypothetical protein